MVTLLNGDDVIVFFLICQTPSGKHLQVMDRDGESYMAQLDATDPEEGVYTCEQPTNIRCLSKAPSPGSFNLTQRNLRDARLLARLVAIEDATDETIQKMSNADIFVFLISVCVCVCV